MATKTKGYGSRLSYSAAGSTYTALTDMAAFTPPSLEYADLKTTNLESTDGVHEYQAGLGEPGEIPGTAYFTKAQFAALMALAGPASDNYYWKITFPLLSGESTASQIIARGHLKKISLDEINIEDDNKVMAPIAIKVTGKWAFTAAT